MICCLFFLPSIFASTFQVCVVSHGVTSACSLIGGAVGERPQLLRGSRQSISTPSGRGGSSAIFFSGRGPRFTTC